MLSNGSILKGLKFENTETLKLELKEAMPTGNTVWEQRPCRHSRGTFASTFRRNTEEFTIARNRYSLRSVIQVPTVGFPRPIFSIYIPTSGRGYRSRMSNLIRCRNRCRNTILISSTFSASESHGFGSFRLTPGLHTFATRTRGLVSPYRPT